MNASRILPDLQCSLISEDVRQEVTGNFILAGILGLIRVPRLPITAHRLCVFNRWTAGLGQFTETVRILAPDQATVLRTAQTKFVLKDAAHHATNVTLLGQAEFKVPGVYSVEVLVDDVMKLRYPLPVVVVPPPSNQPQTPPPAESGDPTPPPPQESPES